MNKSHNKNKGFSLIELMVAMVIGLIILLGLVQVFSASSSLNRTQTGLAVLQENGRYAISRMKADIENAGRKHCATVALPSASTAYWDQGYALKQWRISSGVTFTNGLPNSGDVMLDSFGDSDQIGDTPVPAGSIYPLDPSFFIRGHECDDASCAPDFTEVGADASASFPSLGTGVGDLVQNADVLTVRYVSGNTRVIDISGNVLTLENPKDYSNASTADVLVDDCRLAYVVPATWGSSTVNMSVPTGELVPSFKMDSDVRAFNMDLDFKTVSYFLRVDQDPNNSGRKISSLYRSENGNVQQLVEGVERMDVFYLAQLQTGRVARLTAAQVQQMSGGGAANQSDPLPDSNGCILPPPVDYMAGMGLSNDAGCLWRSIYAIEVHLLLNTVNNSAQTETEPFIYTPDGTTPQTPGTSLVNGLPRERMYRREFNAVIPVRSYTL